MSVYSEAGAAENRALCSECIREVFLRARVEKGGRVSTCSYCGRAGTSFTIPQMADEIEIALKEHYYRTRSEPTGMEYAMMKEGDYDWEREGDPISQVICDCAWIDGRPAEDVRKVLEARHFNWDHAQMGYENIFAAEACYASAEVDDRALQASWYQFEKSLKTQARYFSQTAWTTLQM